eukprot:8956409-Prorocentrum_lima.AAC.1
MSRLFGDITLVPHALLVEGVSDLEPIPFLIERSFSLGALVRSFQRASKSYSEIGNRHRASISRQGILNAIGEDQVEHR